MMLTGSPQKMPNDAQMLSFLDHVCSALKKQKQFDRLAFIADLNLEIGVVNHKPVFEGLTELMLRRLVTAQTSGGPLRSTGDN